MLLGLFGCGGAGSSSDQPAATAVPTQLVAGFVEDGPIVDAKVSLLDPVTGETARRCWTSGVGRCEATTDDRGHFRMQLALDVDPDGYRLVSTGGRDHATGISFEEDGLGFSAPLSAFIGTRERLVLSPLTTLLDRLVQGGSSLDQALQQLTAWAGLSYPGPLLAQPPPYIVLERNLLLVELWRLMRENGGGDPWNVLGQHVLSGQPLFSSGILNQQELAGLLDSPTVTPQRLTEQTILLMDLSRQLEAENSADSAFARVNRALVADLLGRELDTFFTTKDAAVFDSADAAYQANRKQVFSAISDAVNGAVPLWNWIPQKILQHVLFKYHPNNQSLTEFAAFQQTDPALFAAGLVRVADGQTISLMTDSRIAEIASGQPQHRVSQPLAVTELLLPGDNLSRVGYYYNSDISHLSRVDDLARAVLDDQLSDELLVKLVKGTAKSGMVQGWVGDELFPTDLSRLIENRINGSEFRGKAYVEQANVASDWGLFADALEALDRAENYFYVVLNAKGTVFFADSDAENYRELAVGYLNAGNFSAADRVLTYLHQSIARPIGTRNAYAQVFSAGMKLADRAIDQGDLASARSVIDRLRQIAMETPADFSRTGTASYKSRVFHLVETARRYAAIGVGQEVLDLYYGPGMVAELRTDDGLQSGDGTFKNKTGSYTKAYMDEMAQALYQAGDVSGAFSLLDSLSASSRAKGYKSLAAFIALHEEEQGGLLSPHPVEPPDSEMNALDLVYYKVPTDLFNPTQKEAQIDALTYFVRSRTVPFMALSLIDAGYNLVAADVLVQAVDLVRQLKDNQAKPFNLGSSKIDFGFAKIADLYVDIGRDQEARLLLEEAEAQVLPNMTDAGQINQSLVRMADVYLRMGDATAAENLLSRASASLSLDSYKVLIDALFRIHSGVIAGFVADYVTLADQILTDVNLTDKELASIEKHLIYAASFYSALGEQGAAVAVLDRARLVADRVTVDNEHINRLIDWVAGYAKIDDYSGALKAVRAIEQEGFRVSRNKALLAIGEVYAARDDFPKIDTAGVDIDRDGQPDFFNPLATAEEIQNSGLITDDDMDGDGVPDAQDARPMYFDNAR
ncbi:hypothetical protein C2E25_12445 [Geothermobacter hydrogeniphilus]|uniref:Tetratricopeptide repeat-containing protein n=1 Tax=Geothermobacter hydrogeniphilus TaxID=1969733 RepID=A0A2K2H8A0_9BACT|nr:hypothetical protein C2E25_12445 [Geothermobacter hydrogeniphilus]